MIKTLLFCAVALLLGGGILLLPRQKRTKRAGLVLLCVALLFEIFVANFHAFHLLGGGYEKTAVDPESADVWGGEEDGFTVTDGDTLTVTLRDVGQTVGTVQILCDLPEGTDYADVSIDVKDASQTASYRSRVADGQLIRGNRRTAVLVLDLTGEVDSLRIRITPEKGGSLTLEGLCLNAPVPMELSALRLLLLMLVGLVLYALATFPALRAPLEEQSVLCGRLVGGVTACLMLFAVALTLLYQYDRTGTLFSNFLSRSGNQITKELVDAFCAGQVHLLQTPSEELLALENPYDWSQRSAAGVSYLWDHLLFDGKYYSYYGIAPVLLLFLPYHLITGAYFPTPEAVLLFGALGILFLSLLLWEAAKRFCKQIPVNMILTALVVIQLSSGVYYNFVSPLFYEIAQTAGFFFTCAGFYFLLRSGVVGEGRIRLPFLTLATLCLSLAVLSRPTLALHCIVSLPFIGYGLLKRRGELPNSGRLIDRGTVTYLCAALLPFVLLGGGQMLYNYARFGSFLDFGIQYSLTINDFTRAQYHTDFVAIGFYNFLLAFPQIHPNFPYVFSNYSNLSVNGYYFLATNNAGGLLWRALPTFGYVGVGGAWKTLSRSEKKQVLLLLLPLCLIAPAVIMFSIWESGYAVRYCTDFAWQLILGGIAVLFLLYARRAEEQTKTILQRFFILSALLSLIVNAGLLYGFMHRDGYLHADFLSLERLFDFWK